MALYRDTEAVPLTQLDGDEIHGLAHDDDISDDDTLLSTDPLHSKTRVSSYQRRYGSWYSLAIRLLSSIYYKLSHHRRRSRKHVARRSFWYRLWRWVVFIVVTFVSASLLNGILRPSYQNPPAHYGALEDRISKSHKTGRGNPDNEKIFIAANIINENLIRNEWGISLMELVQLLGPENVFVSVYENDSGKGTGEALRELQTELNCNSSIITGAHLPLTGFPTIKTPSGEDRVQRITYLAEVRNRLLQPLAVSSAGNTEFGFKSAADVKFDKVLFLNDVYFNPVDALHLLFSTNAEGGKAKYRTACAIDFQHGIMFYDNFVVRDIEGYEIGLMFYPWFTSSGKGESRTQVRRQLDAVGVRSCWGGMAAFDAAVFQTQRSSLPADQALVPAHPPPTDSNIQPRLPLSFRGSHEPFWEESECCLIFADIESLFGKPSVDDGTGVFINPYVRVAYTKKTWIWLNFWRRYERVFEFLQYFMSKAAWPEFNPRRTHEAGEKVEEIVWVTPTPDDNSASAGRFGMVERTAEPGGFCGQRRMFVMVSDVEEANKSGSGKNWEKIEVPPGG